MKKLYFLLFTFLITVVSFGQDMVITGAFDGPLSGGLPKLVEIYVINDIADLSTYGFGSANNGGGTDGEELEFTGSAMAGDFIYIGSEGPSVTTYFGITADYIDSSANVNGDDALELFSNDGTVVIDTFGDIAVDGTGQAWEYLDGGAYRVSGTGPDGGTFQLGNWLFTGPNAVDGCTSNATCGSELPIGTYSTTPVPFVSISSPADMEVLSPGTTSVDIEFVAGNLQMGDQVDITITIDAGSPATFTNESSPFTLTPTADGESYEVTVEIVNGGVIDFETINFSIGTATQVADISTLRGGAQDGTFYELTGEALLTYQQDFRGQKFIEDGTGAILIDDDSGVISTIYSIGDGITGLIGTLSEFGGMIQFVPSIDPGVASSTGNTLSSQSVTLLDLTNNPENYESELVTVTAVTMDNSTPSFTGGSVHSMSQSGNMFDFRSTFFDADYVTGGGIVPTTSTDITGIINERFDNEYYLTARDTNDFSTPIVLSTGDIGTNDFSIFPNPTNLGFVNLSSRRNSKIDVSVFDVLGKQFLKSTVKESRLDVRSLKSGLYVLKISQDNVVSTKRLIIQ